jgi:hypothetical protein
LKVQAGKRLCVSETIYPGGSHHGMNLVYHGIDAAGGSRRAYDALDAGDGFTDLRESSRSGTAPIKWTGGCEKRSRRTLEDRR